MGKLQYRTKYYRIYVLLKNNELIRHKYFCAYVTLDIICILVLDF